MAGQAARPAWMQMRRQVVAAATLFLVAGAVLAMMGWAADDVPPIIVGVVLAGFGSAMLMIRPWTYLRSMEARAAAYRQSLELGQMRKPPIAPGGLRGRAEGEGPPRTCETCGMLLDHEGGCRMCKLDR